MGFLRFCVHEKIISGNDVSSARCYPRELCPGFSSGQYSLSIVGLTFGESGTGYDSGTCHVREEKGINASMPRYRASDQLSRLRLRQSRQQFPSYPGSFLSYRYWCGLIYLQNHKPAHTESRAHSRRAVASNATIINLFMMLPLNNPLRCIGEPIHLRNGLFYHQQYRAPLE